MNPVAKKSLMAILVAIICTTFILLTYYLGMPGKILGSIVFTLIGIFVIFEFIKPFEIPKWTKFIIPLSAIFIMLMPFDHDFLNFIRVDNSELTNLKPLPGGGEPEYKFILIDLIGRQFMFFVANIPGIGFLIVALFILVPCLFIKNKKKIISTFLIILTAIIIICFAIKFIFYLLILQFSLTLVILFAVMLTDIFGYFGGKFFGNKLFKRKLAPNISPNKTIEGALIGFIVSCLFLFLIFGLEILRIPGGINFGKLGNINKWALLFVTPFAIPIISIIGDLLFSFVKRKLEIKDFSNLIPSHGGILDRFDSTILVFFIFPFFIAFVQ